MSRQRIFSAPGAERAILAPWAARPWAAIVVVLLGSWVIAASSWIEAPMWPVPMTAQTFAVLLVGALGGARLAAATLAAYLVQGALGLPVFAGGAAGPAHLAGPTGGFLIGFLVGAAMIGAMVEHGAGRSFLRVLAAMGLAHAVIFVFGVAQLALFVGWPGAIAGGLTPFIAGSIVKTFAAAAAYRMAATARASIK